MNPTHEVLNQPPALVDTDLFLTDRALVEALEREGGGWAKCQVSAFGRKAGSAEVIAWGFQANENDPKLRTHDRFGYRIDEVEFHPAWHQLMSLGISAGIAASPWKEPRAGAHVARAAAYRVLHEIESGTSCPITMTFAAVPAIRQQPEIAREWEPLLLSGQYDPSFRPVSSGKKGALMGMGMTEKQGGSDVRANTTRAVPAGSGGPGAEYLLTGHKWFCSAPMCDAFLMLAQAPKGLSCFFVPRWLPDGTRNRFYIQRLKDKLGNRSNASSEIELGGTWARLVGEEGRGVPTIVEMVHHTRLDCVIGSSALMRQAVAQATHHVAYRSAFGKKLLDQPLMQNVLADLCVESEAATMLMMRLARAFDRRSDKDFESPFGRIATAISKYWVCKRASAVAYEALECLGGAGYVEESILPRIYREAPLNSIWEGSGNVNCLDVFRAIGKEPGALPALRQELDGAKGGDPRYDAFVASLDKDLVRAAADPAGAEVRARVLVERMALALQGSLVVRYGKPELVEAFCATRLAGDWGRCFGTLPAHVSFRALVERARPEWTGTH
jgi:putative acyl-CoA dehydrogenase